MTRIVGPLLILYVSAVVGLPLGNLAISLGILAFICACVLTIVSATQAAQKPFAWGLGLLAFGAAWPALGAFARQTAWVVVGGGLLFALLYFMGARTLKQHAESAGGKAVPPPQPRPRLRADSPSQNETVALPSPDDKPFDLFARENRRGA